MFLSRLLATEAPDSLPTYTPNFTNQATDLLVYAQDQQRQGNYSIAGQIYATIAATPEDESNENSISAALPRRAQEQLDAMNGAGGWSAARFEFLATQFFDQVTDPASLGAMLGAGLTFRLGRLALLRPMAPIARNFRPAWQPLVQNALANGLAFSAEASLFPIYHRLGDMALGRSTDWSRQSLRDGIAESFMVLGGLRCFGTLAGRGARIMGNRPWQQIAFHQLGQYGGIIAGHQAAAHLLHYLDPELHVHRPGITQTLTEALITHMQFNGIGRLLRLIPGPVAITNPPRSRQTQLGALQLALLSHRANLESLRGHHQASPHREARNLIVLSEGQGRESTSSSREGEWDAMADALEQSRGNIEQAAKALAISSSLFWSKLGQARRSASPESKIHDWLQRFSSTGRKQQRMEQWNEMATALSESRGNITEAARLIDIKLSTFRHRLKMAADQATQGSAIRVWTDQLSPRHRQSQWEDIYQQMADALSKTRGNISTAAHSLDWSINTFQTRLKRARRTAPENSSIRIWCERLSSSERQKRIKKTWLRIARSTASMGGNQKAAADQLRIPYVSFQKHFSRMFTFLQTQTEMSYFSRVLLDSLGLAKPTHPSILRMARESQDPSKRFILSQSLISESAKAITVLQAIASSDATPLVRFAAQRNIKLSRRQRILLFLNRTNGSITIDNLLRGTGIRRGNAIVPFRELRAETLIIVANGQELRLSPAGKTQAQQLHRERGWENLNLALESSHGSQPDAARLLGITRQMVHIYLRSAFGRFENGKGPDLGPGWRVPNNHPLIRWSDPNFVKSQKHRARIQGYREAWIDIAAALETTQGNFLQTSQILAISELRVRRMIRLARAYAWEPSSRWTDPAFIAQRRRAKRQAELARQIEIRRRQWQDHSPLRMIPTQDLAFSNPPRNTPEEIKREYALRHQFGDRLAGQRLFHIYQYWVQYYSRRRHFEGISLEGLNQAGHEGLFEAAQRFDPNYDNRFSTYAQYYVLKNQMDLIRSHFSTHLSRNQQQALIHLNRLLREARIHGTIPSAETLAAQLDINVEELTHLQSLATARYARSLDQPIHEDGGSLHQRLSNGNDNGNRQQLRARFTNLLRGFIKTYRRRSGQVVPREILMAEEEDLADVAQRFGISREAVREQQEEMRQSLREFLLENGIDESFFD